MKNNRTLMQKQFFPIKLNDEQRHGICLRIALGWTTRRVQAWLQELAACKSLLGSTDEQRKWQEYLELKKELADLKKKK